MAKSPPRIILKLSGELFGNNGDNINFSKYEQVSQNLVKIVADSNIQLAVVVGGGNIFRGRQANQQVDHTEADSMGMLATVINGIGLREALHRNGAPHSRLMIAFHIPELAEPYIKHKGRHHLDHNRIVIIAGGLGRPNFSTDSAVAQYADELQCQLILKASTVDGVYSADPKTNPKAKKYSTIMFKQALQQDLGIMDTTAFAMCMRSHIPVFVFNIADLAKIPSAVRGDHSFGTLIKN